jgi:ABC-type bacteriocin/lantibiotic exporter with double-glycine peptidase domain
MGRLLIVLIGLSSAGCSYLGTAEGVDPADLDREEGWIRVEGVPVVLQRDQEDCGAAALAMALAYWKVPTSLEEVARDCPPDPGQGIKAGTLRDYARRKGLQAFLIHGNFSDLQKELSKGRPLLVGLVKPYVNGGLTHFEVVVGLHPGKEEVVTLDPARGWRKNGYAGFVTEWEPSKRLTLVLLKPREGTSGD